MGITFGSDTIEHSVLVHVCFTLIRLHTLELQDFYATALHFAAGKRRMKPGISHFQRHSFQPYNSLVGLNMISAGPGCCNAIVQSGRCLDVNAKDNKGQTALHLAALRADRESGAGHFHLPCIVNHRDSDCTLCSSRSYAAIAAHPDCNPLLPDNQGKFRPHSPDSYAFLSSDSRTSNVSYDISYIL